MIVLDTNVLSEAVGQSPSETVMRWLARQDRTSVFTTAISEAEILYGIELMPSGKRRDRLQIAVGNLFTQGFRGRVLPFDEDSAQVFPKIVAGRDRIGHPISQFDALIASICRARRAVVATRNVADFEDCGIPVVNPWTE